MRKEAPMGLAFIEKLFGILIIIMGAIVFQYTRLTKEIESVGFGLFIFFGLVLIALGVFMILAKGR
jgi:hypothetical protein